MSTNVFDPPALEKGTLRVIPLGGLGEIGRNMTVYEIDGKLVRDFPSTPSLMRAKPVYTVLPGWKSDVRGITEWDKLPENCRKYVEFIEKEIEVPVRMLSTGPKRSEVLYRK